jgi:thiol-disulfide isomerase/thioredoxin
MRKGFITVILIALITSGVVLLRHLAAPAEAGGPAKLSKAAPEFPRNTEWLQSEPLTLASLRGQVVVVHFWTNGCINCIHNYPVYRAWQEKYAGQAVKILGVHTPEFASEADVVRIRSKARENALKFPIAVDNDSRIWKSWDNHYWPSIYLVDKKGRVRYRWEGELHLREADGQGFASHIDELLAEKP